MNIGLKLDGAVGIGDQLMFSSFPENFFAATGAKLIDVDNVWCFDSNPFIERNKTPDTLINPRIAALPQSISIDNGGRREFLGSVAERTMAQYSLDVSKLVLRHPRLYRFENGPLKKRVVVHTTGRTSKGQLSHNTMDFIASRYHEFEIVQVGSKEDISFPKAIDFRGASIWDTTQVISECSVFIGVDSGPSWIASCYPQISCKTILSGFSAPEIRAIQPMIAKLNGWHWYDSSRQYFNESEFDNSFTYSFLKL